MKTFVIAEAGVNHNGSLSNALKLVDCAKDAGSDAVKFQTFKTENLVLKDALSAPYQKKETGRSSQFKLLKSLELKFEDFEEIKRHCENINIEFISTPFDIDSLHFLNSICVKKIKLSSGDFNNFHLIKHAAEKNIDLILSTGMTSEKEIIETSDFLFNKLKFAPNKATFLQCTTAYPTPPSEVNLSQLVRLKEILPCQVGLSDHTQGYHSVMMAVAIGISIVEKHFTLSRELKGPDHKSSLEPNELKDYVTKIRLAEQLMGNQTIKPSPTELENMNHARKGLYFSKSIPKGKVISEADILVSRPQNGVSPTLYWSLIGKTLKQDVLKYAPVNLTLFK